MLTLHVKTLLYISIGYHLLANAARWTAMQSMRVTEYFAEKSAKTLVKAQERILKL